MRRISEQSKLHDTVKKTENKKKTIIQRHATIGEGASSIWATHGQEILRIQQHKMLQSESLHTLACLGNAYGPISGHSGDSQMRTHICMLTSPSTWRLTSLVHCRPGSGWSCQSLAHLRGILSYRTSVPHRRPSSIPSPQCFKRLSRLFFLEYFNTLIY